MMLQYFCTFQNTFMIHISMRAETKQAVQDSKVQSSKTEAEFHSPKRIPVIQHLISIRSTSIPLHDDDDARTIDCVTPVHALSKTSQKPSSAIPSMQAFRQRPVMVAIRDEDERSEDMRRSARLV